MASLSPGLVCSRLAACFLAGLLLGPAADLFRPLHRRFPVLSQLLIGAEFFACWLWCGFGLCRAQLHFGYFLDMLAGFFLWERCFGSCITGFLQNYGTLLQFH